MPYADSEPRFIDVKKAFASVRIFVQELYGGNAASFITPEEIELDPDTGVWLITVSISSPTAFVTGKQDKDLKQFAVNAKNGEVLSMKIYHPR